ncbi:N-acetylmuramoyl-L-alanine amidase family protein [Anaeroselena agilis]|uniref:N-acetylmuramoyl-L-alanine amidase n=1 Tax=Anaeroselena agilis TaxID=3063788 RepID=A0ABU3NYE1_9FIRM|nr:N-acetylmuramoyl-L-alanine amidase [Selenomonadales bacterium 4137-cl]
MARIMLDPGHDGAVDPGAIGAGGTQEAVMAMTFCEELARILASRGHEVELTRYGPDAEMESLTKRAVKANAWGADVLLSVHYNAFVSAGAHGFEVWTTSGHTHSDDLATLIYNNITAIVPEVPGRPDMSDGDPDKEENFTVITVAAMPAVLIELLFITNPTEEMLANDATFRQRQQEAIALAVDQFLGVA